MRALKYCLFCGSIVNRDENAALNILDAGIGELQLGVGIGRPRWMQR